MPANDTSPARDVRTAHTCALLVPLALADLVIAGWMSFTALGIDPGMWQWWWSLRSVALFHLGSVTLWLLAVKSGWFARHRWSGYALLHLYFTLLSALIVCNAGFFYYLDIQIESNLLGAIWPLLQAGIWTLIQDEVSPLFLAGAVLTVGGANLFPRIVIWLLRLRRRPASPRTPLSRRTRVATAMTAVVLLVVASIVPDGIGSTRFTRERLPAIAVGLVKDVLEESPEPVPAAELPLRTRVVPAAGGAKPYNIVTIVLESQRASSVSHYNKALDTTPEFDALARESIVADRAFTAVPHTSKSLVTSHCGVVPPLDTHNSEGKPGGFIARCLPRLLADRGYSSAFFQSPTENFENRGHMVSGLGFQEFFPLEKLPKEDFEPVNPLGYEDDIMVEPSVRWAAQQPGPFMLSYMTVTAHYDYALPEDFPEETYVDERYAGDESYSTYLNAVRYQDRFVGKVIDAFKAAGLYDNTIFVVMGDHGEGFREHGRRIHNDTIWNEGIQVPLLIRVPGMTTTQRITRPVSNTAVLPTLVDLLGLKVEGGSYDYHSMLDPQPQPVMTSCWDPEQCVSMVDRDHKFIHFFGQQPDAYYDLTSDPGETRNLIDQLSEAKRRRYVDRLHDWLDHAEARYAGSHTPLASPQAEGARR